MELDARKQKILQAIVDDYIATAEPVGSHVLLTRHALGVKSATIRNEMAEMSEQGYLRQPHTSAGRVPADRGYRFYVNRLMPLPVVNRVESDGWRDAAQQASQELDAVLQRTCRLLSAMTRLPAVAIAPTQGETRLRQIFVSPAGAEKTLLVLLFSTGQVENRIVEQAKLSHGDALFLANGLNERFADRTPDELTQKTADAPPAELGALRVLWNVLVREMAQAVKSLASRTPVYVEGTDALVELPEFRDLERLERLLSTLQQGAAVAEMLESSNLYTLAHGASRYPADVSVRIGSENPQPALMDCALITSRYRIAGRESGTIGVLGSTRMDYRRTTAAVAFMARNLGELLTRLSVMP